MRQTRQVCVHSHLEGRVQKARAACCCSEVAFIEDGANRGEGEGEEDAGGEV